MGVKKYFLAIVIPEPFQSRIEAVKQELFEAHHLKGALRSDAHITLHRPFEWKEEKEPELIDKLGTFKFDRSFTIELNNFSFFEPRVIYVDVLPNEPLFELHRLLTSFVKRELRLFNEADDERGFHPHVTVAFRDLKKPLFYELQKTFAQRRFAGSFDHRGFSILKLGQRWEVLHDFNI